MENTPKILQQSVGIGNVPPDKNHSLIDTTKDPKQLVADIIGFSSQQFLINELAKESKKTTGECRKALEKESWRYGTALATLLKE